MLTRTGTLTINPAFLQEVKQDNVHLRELLDATSAALSGARTHPIRPRALVELLGRLRDQLATHFSLEEFFGYFEDAVDAAPRLSVKADIYRSQHETLYISICDLTNEAERLLYGESHAAGLDLLSLRFHNFYRELQEHEENENDLIMEALYDDIGVGD